MPDVETDKEALRLRPGMPPAERQALRERILAAAIERATREAMELHLSPRCLMHQDWRQPGLSYDQRRAEHVRCQGESIGDGCLCPMHDDEIRKTELKATPPDPDSPK